MKANEHFAGRLTPDSSLLLRHGILPMNFQQRRSLSRPHPTIRESRVSGVFGITDSIKGENESRIFPGKWDFTLFIFYFFPPPDR